MIQILILINFSIVFLIDQSGFINEFKSWLKKLLTNGKMKDSNYSIKPFDCSLCMTFWVSIIYLLIINNLTIESFALVCVSAWLTTFTNDIYIVIKEMWTKIINKIL